MMNIRESNNKIHQTITEKIKEIDNSTVLAGELSTSISITDATTRH